MKPFAVYFELPVSDLDRAQRFYESVFEIELQRTEIDGHSMALFPEVTESPGITGALVHGESYTPSKQGARVYFKTLSIEEQLRRVVDHGGIVLYPKKSVGDLGYVAEFEDSEGNCIALHES